MGDWNNVLNTDDVNNAYDVFWSTYNELFQLNFPVKKMRFNKNIHCHKPFRFIKLPRDQKKICISQR